MKIEINNSETALNWKDRFCFGNFELESSICNSNSHYQLGNIHFYLETSLKVGNFALTNKRELKYRLKLSIFRCFQIQNDVSKFRLTFPSSS